MVKNTVSGHVPSTIQGDKTSAGEREGIKMLYSTRETLNLARDSLMSKR